MMIARTSSCTFLPLRILAASAMSSRRPLVQEPMTTCWIGTSPTSSMVLVFSGRCGKETVGFSCGQIDVIRLQRTLRLRQAVKTFHSPCDSAFHIIFGDLVHHENAVFSAGFDSHIGYAQTVFHGEALEAFSHEFHGFIKRSIHADHTDDVKDHVFSC